MEQQGPKAAIGVIVKDETQEGLGSVKRSVQDTAQAVTKAGQEASKGISQIGAGADQTARRLESFEKSWVNSVQRALVATEAGEKGTAKYFEAWGKYRGIGGDVMEPILAQLRAAEAAQEAASASMGRMGMSAKATAAAMRGVPAQLSDIFVSIQGGMPLFTVFTQQGLQLRDMFGGFGAAGKALATTVAGMVNPLTVAGAAAVAVGAAYYKGSKEVEALRVSLVSTGNSMGASVTQLRQFAAEMGAVSGNEAKASAALADFVSAGVRGTTMLKENAQAAIDWEKATGASVEKTAKAFASLQDEPLKAAMDLQKGMNFLTVATYEQAKALDEQGRKTEATALLQREYAKALNQGSSEIRDNLGTLERTWDKLGKTASTVWNLMLGVGRSATLADKIGGLREEISNTERQLAAGTGFSETAGGAATGRGGRLTQKDIELLQQRLALNKQNLAVLEEEARQDQVKAERKAEEGRRVSALDEWNQRELKYLSDAKKLERELEQERQLGRRAGLDEEEINKRLNAMREEAAKKDKDAAKAAKEHKKELSEQAKVYADLAGLSSTYYDDLARGQKELAKGIMTQAQYVKYVEDLIKKQPFAIALAKEEERVTLARVKAWNDEVKVQEKLLEERQRAAAQVEETLKKAKDEEEAHILAAAAGITHAEALARIALARAEDSYQKELAKGADAETLLALQKEIEARKQLQVVMQQKGVREANKKAADDAAKDWDRTAQTISRTLSDYIMAGGKNAAQYLKRLFATLVLEPGVQTVVGSVFGVSKSAMAGGSDSAGGIGSALSGASNLSSLYSAFTGGITGTIGSAIGSLGSAFGSSALTSFATGIKGATLAPGLAGPVLSGPMGATGAMGLGASFGAAIPWIAGGLAVASLLGGLDFGSRGANHTGGAYSTSTTDRNSAASMALGSDAWGNALGDITSRANTALDAQLGKTVDALSGVYTSLAKYAGDSAKQIDIAAAFAVNPSHSDEDNYAYFQLRDKISGELLSTYKARDGVLGTDPEKAYATAMGKLGSELVGQLMKADIPGWMRSIFSGLGEDITLDGLNQALQAIAVVDAAFKGWANTLQGFSGLSAEAQTALLNVSGGIEGLATNVNTFYGGFYSEAERMGILQRQVLEQLAGLDVSVDTSTAEAAKESFRQAVEGALAAGNGELAAKLLALSGSFTTAADYAAQSAEKIVTTAQESAKAAIELAANLRSSLIDLGERLPGAGAEVRQLRAEDLAGQVQGLFTGVGIQKDAGVLAGQILSATNGEVEEYFRSMWSMLDTDEARQKLVTVTGALLDLAGSAETAANAIKQEREGLEQRWLQATGNTAELRRRELEALDPSNRALLEMIYGLEDAKTSMTDLTNAAQTAAQQAAAAWQNWGTAAGLGATYLGDTSGLEARRAILGSQITASTDPADRLAKLQELISVEQAISQAQQASRKTELEAINARQSALQKEVASAQQLLSAAQGLGSYVQSLRLGEASGLSEADRLSALGSEYTSLIGKARGGDADALQRLQSVAGDYLGLSRSMSASGSDYAVLAGSVASELEAVAKAQELVAQSGITAREAEIAQLTQQNEYLSASVELSDETKRLIQKSMLEQQDVWGRESMRAETLQELQQRAVDSLALMPAGIASAIKPTIESSAAYIAGSVQSVTSAVNALAGLLGMDGSHAAGLAFVPRDGYRAELHFGERVLTAEENRAYSLPQPVVPMVVQQAAFGNGSSSARLEALVERLLEENRRQAGEIVRLNLRVARVLEQWEGDGMPPQRKEGATA